MEVKPRFFFIAIAFLFIEFFPLFQPLLTYAAPYTLDNKTDVSASVGDFYLNISGFISPRASIVLNSTGVFLGSTVADANGNFVFNNILIRKGFSGFCLTAVDFKRLGESTTCFTFPPALGSIRMDGLFLPPTLGLSRTEINEGATVYAFGYTMPNASVVLNYGTGKLLRTNADARGYYEFAIKGLKAGTYKVYSQAQYQGKQSLAPTKVLSLRALTLLEQSIKLSESFWNKFIKLFTSIGFATLLLIIPLMLAILFLILKIWPERFRIITESKYLKYWFYSKDKIRRPLHHAWFVGF